MAILVTGGAGFIGSHLMERLLSATTEDLVCLDNFNAYYDPRAKRDNAARFAAHPRVTVVEDSFCNSESMQRLFAAHEVTAVIHVGAYAGVRNSFLTPTIYEATNVGGTVVLLETARRHAVRRFVLISSSTVYGLDATSPFVEDQPLGTPASPYGATKRAAEVFASMYYRVHGLPTVILRPFSVYGPRLRPDLAMTVFADAILTGRPLVLYGDGSVRRDFTFVDDVCDGIVACLTTDGIAGEAINLGSDKPIAMTELIAELERAMGRQACVEHRAPIVGDLPVTCASTRKAERLLGYRPQVDFPEGVRRFVAWFTQAGNGAAIGTASA